MADDELRQFEAMLGAFANMASEREEQELTGVKCPKCGGASFAKVSDVYEQAVGRSDDGPDATTVRIGDLTDKQIVDRLAPPGKRSATAVAVIVMIPLAAAAYFVYSRYGSLIGELAGFGAGVITLMVFLTRTRALSDAYYTGRARWRKLFICRQCGQLVSP